MRRKILKAATVPLKIRGERDQIPGYSQMQYDIQQIKQYNIKQIKYCQYSPRSMASANGSSEGERLNPQVQREACKAEFISSKCH